MTARVLKGPGGSEEQVYEDELFTDYKQLLFTRAVAVAEKMGKEIKLLVVPSNDAFQATVMTAIELECSTLVAGVSTKMSAAQQAKKIGDVWEAIQHPNKRKLRVLKLINPDESEIAYELGAHRPNVTPEDVELAHRLWLELAKENEHLHHNQVVSVALRRLAKDLQTTNAARLFPKSNISGREQERMAKVKMYTTTWCPDCRMAKKYLDTNGIAYEEINIETEPGAAEFVMSVNAGKRKVPTFVVGTEAFHNSPFSFAVMEEKFGR